MDFANRGSRPNAVPQQSMGMQQEQQTQSFQPISNTSNKKKRKFNFDKTSSGVLLVGVTLLILTILFGFIFGIGDRAEEAEQIQTDKYQAVFLNSQDGQVYFGRLNIYNENLYALTDIYYVRVENPIQPEGAKQTQQSTISLAKLGSELHGPQDVMYISRDKVLYWENLKDDGQVVTAITKYKESGETTPTETPQKTESTAPAETPTESVPTTPAP